MPTISLIGATGRTGRGVLQILLTEPYRSYDIRIYVRSKAKLLSIFPDLASYARVSVFEGSIADINLFKQCLSSADTIISVLGENENIAGLHILQDAATTTVSALQELCTENPNYEIPRLVLLSSATWNAAFAGARPRFIHWLIKTAFCYPYADLLKAQEIYAQRPDLLRLCLIQPPAIVEGESSGHILSTETVTLVVSYGDLASGFVEVATKAEHRDIEAIGVSSTSKDQKKYLLELQIRIVRGFLAQYVPGYFSIENKVWGLLGYA
ncbi:hypothetical protein MW887_003642 [Aspergillus wentii]|nr:hypothetical protein MW887_003642 [Aspergillus wentii]